MISPRILSVMAATAAILVGAVAAAERPDVDTQRSRAVREGPLPGQAEAPGLAEELPYDGGPVPHGYRYQARPRTATLWTGAIMFWAGWGTSAVIGASVASCTDTREDIISDNRHCVNNDKIGAMYLIPIVGPMIPGAIGIASPSGSDQALGWLSMATGAAQLLGATLWISATALGPEQLVVRDSAKRQLPSAMIAPVAYGKGGVGLSMSGAF